MKPDPADRLSPALIAAVFVAALVGCGLGCGLALNWLAPGRTQPPSAKGHDWLHQQLDLTPSQRERLDGIEALFEERESSLEAALATANRQLGKTIREERAYTPSVDAAVAKVHEVMAELQKATIEHLFDMEEVLTPVQFDRLLELAGEALE